MDLKPGSKAFVTGIDGEGALRRRMMDMGIVPGVEIEVVRSAPWGGPVQLMLKGYYLAMRRSECSAVVVEELGESGRKPALAFGDTVHLVG